MTWNFTEASHGKGAPDGVGAALKNLADIIVSYGTSIPDADTLFEQLMLNSSVRLFKVTEEDIKRSGELVPPHLKSVPGTMRVHQVSQLKNNNIFQLNTMRRSVPLYLPGFLAEMSCKLYTIDGLSITVMSVEVHITHTRYK